MARQEQSSAEQKVAGIGQTFSFLEAAQPQAGSRAHSSHIWPATLGPRDGLRTLQKMDTNKSVSWGRHSLGSWGRTAGRLSIGPGSTRRKELKEILLQSNSPGSTLRLATTQKTSNSSSLLPGPQQEQKPEQNPDLLPLVLDPLEHAWLLTVAQGDAESIIKLLDLDPTLLNRRDFVTGFTALHWLAKHGLHESFIQVISHAQKKGYPVNVNIPTASGGLTPLHLAALQGHEVLIKVLVGAYGADTSCRDHNGRKAWQYLRADTSRDLKELAGALEEDFIQLRSHNTNNNWEMAADEQTKSLSCKCFPAPCEILKPLSHAPPLGSSFWVEEELEGLVCQRRAGILKEKSFKVQEESPWQPFPGDPHPREPEMPSPTGDGGHAEEAGRTAVGWHVVASVATGVQKQLWKDDSLLNTIEKICEDYEIIFIATEVMLKNETVINAAA